MITTRESISYQFTLMFGYSSPKDMLVGDLIGPSKLSSHKLKEISQSIIKFTRMFNALLTDFAGSELHSIEFELYNINKGKSSTKIYPRSMVLMPGKYKDCEALMLALKPDTGYLDVHKSRSSINDICRLFFEIELFTDRPDLNDLEKEKVLTNFTQRFSKKLYGNLLEDKWNKKLVGVSSSLPTEKGMIQEYSIVEFDVDIKLNKKPIEIDFLKPQIQKIDLPIEKDIELEHLKYAISDPSALFIVENSLKLGINLLDMTNTGTIDDTQKSITSYFIEIIEEELKKESEIKTSSWLETFISKKLEEIKQLVSIFAQLLEKFLLSGESGSLDHVLEKLEAFFQSNYTNNNQFFSRILQIAIFSIRRLILNRDNIRASDLKSSVNYLNVITNVCFNIILTSLPKYLLRRKLLIFLREFIEKLNDIAEKEQEPARNLALQYFTKLREFMHNKVEVYQINNKSRYTDNYSVVKLFKKIIRENLDEFFSKISLNITEIIAFAEINMTESTEIITEHLNKFKTFSGEIRYLTSYLLRYSTINRFLKEIEKENVIDPVTFASIFHRYLEKRIGGINLEWKAYILEWVNDYAKIFFKNKDFNVWHLNEIYKDFIMYFKKRQNSELDPGSFVKFLDSYITKIDNIEEKKALLDFFQQYELFLGIETEFPNYVKELVQKEYNETTFSEEQIQPIEYLQILGEDSFLEFLEDREMKYFSELIPRPKSLVFRHNLDEEEKKKFHGTLFHVFNFSYNNGSVNLEISNNFNKTYRTWLTK